MTDNKLTDEQIIEAFERCCNGELGRCKNCPVKIAGKKACIDELHKLVFDVLHRQKAEIEELEKANLQLMAILQTAQSEARKEFVERFKTKLSNLEYRDENPNMKQKGEWILHEAIPIAVDKVLKEMEGD